MEQLDPLINAAFLACGDHRQQQPPLYAALLEPQPTTAAAPSLHQHLVRQQPPSQMVVHNVVHNNNSNTMHPPPPIAAGGGQPLQSHPALPQLQIATAAAAPPQPPKKKSRTTINTTAAQSDPSTAANSSSPSNSNNNHHLSLNHPQNEAYKLKTNQYLLETSSRLDDAVSELAHYTSLLSSFSNASHNSSKKQKAVLSECIANMEQSIIPLLKLCSNTVKDTGKFFAPFSGTGNIHNRNDAERKRKLVLLEQQQQQQQQQQQRPQQSVGERRAKKRPALLMIDEFVKRSQLIVSTTVAAAADTNTMTTTTNDNNNKQSHHQEEVVGGGLLKKRKAAAAAAASSLTSSSSSSSTKNKSSSSTTESIIILQPQNGSVYTKSEAIAICKRYKKGTRERGLAIRAMVDKKFVLSSRKTLYRLLQQDEDGKVLVENGWLGCGRPMKVDFDCIGGSFVPKSQKFVNSSLTFEELDRGEENRILVELTKGGGGSRGDDYDDDDDDEEVNDDTNAATTNKKQQLSKIKSQKKGSGGVGLCTASGCTNQIARRGLCVKHGMQVVDPKIIAFPLPPPKDGGDVYKKSECVEIAKQYKKGSSKRRLALEAMIYRGYAKNSLKSLYRLLLNDEKGIPIPDDDWRGMGCPSVLSAQEIDEVIERIKREDIRLASDDDVRRLVLDALKAKGVTDESKLKFSATTVKNYGAIFKSKLSAFHWKNDVESQQHMVI